MGVPTATIAPRWQRPRGAPGDPVMVDVADLLAELIEIDSTNPSLVPGAPA